MGCAGSAQAGPKYRLEVVPEAELPPELRERPEEGEADGGHVTVQHVIAAAPAPRGTVMPQRRARRGSVSPTKTVTKSASVSPARNGGSPGTPGGGSKRWTQVREAAQSRLLQPASPHSSPTHGPQRSSLIKVASIMSSRSGSSMHAAASAAEWPHDYDALATIGKGGVARVKLVRRNTDQHFFAVKVMLKSELVRRNFVRHARMERELLLALDHPFVVRLHDTFQDQRRIYFLMEFVAGGELFTRLHTLKRLPNDVAKFYAAEVLLALEHMHAAGVAYRDLKPENILIDRTGHIKVADFGFSRRVPADGRCFTKLGTPHYLAPEQLNRNNEQGYTMDVDWWAYGCLLYEMLRGRSAFGKSGDSPWEIYLRIMSGKPPSMPLSWSGHARSLIRQLLQPDLPKRLTDPARIRAHPWFQGLDWEMARRRRLRPPFVPALQHDGDAQYFDTYSDDDSDEEVHQGSARSFRHKMRRTSSMRPRGGEGQGGSEDTKLAMTQRGKSMRSMRQLVELDDDFSCF